MELTGQRVLPVDRATTWKALNDPAILKQAIPGCETIESTGENQYTVTVQTALGPVRAKFRGKLRLEDVVPPESYTIRFEGDGGMAGFAKGHSRVKLTEIDGKTTLDYTASAQVGGKIAQVGNRLVDSAARKLADDFFTAFEKIIGEALRSSQDEKSGPSAVVPSEARVPPLHYFVIGTILAGLVASIAYTLR
jgi:uncharacterized protein